MSCPEKIKALLKNGGVDVGDEVEVKSGARIYKGILMPHHEFSDEDIVTIKLSNGYNVGISMDLNTEVKLIKKGKSSKKPSNVIESDENKPTITLLSTGGTIASYVDYRTGAVHPALTAEDLAYSTPELHELCNIKAKVLFSILSENMKGEYWQELAREIAREFKEGVRGVIVPHGTDTMAYTSAALSFMLKNLPGPVVLVGSQRSSDRPSSDAYFNLLSSTRLILGSDLAEVVLVMHSETSDSSATVHRGTRARKMHTSKRDAFQSINEQPLGTIENEKINLYQGYKKRSGGEIELKDKMEKRVILLYFYPGLTSDTLQSLANNNKGIVIAGTGLGHVSTDLIEILKDIIQSGVPVVMTSQCLHGRVNMNIYSSGRDLLKAGVIPGEDMLAETALVKLMWVLGQTKDIDQVKKLMLYNLSGEIGESRTFSDGYQ